MYRIRGTIPTRTNQMIRSGQLRCHSDHLIGGQTCLRSHRNDPPMMWAARPSSITARTTGEKKSMRAIIVAFQAMFRVPRMEGIIHV
jgi:hypothetical protein